MQNKVVILLGANLGDKLHMFAQVRTYIEEHIGLIINQSAIYASKSWGFNSPDEFYNQLLVVETEFSAYDTLLRCQSIETKCGRTRTQTSGYESRVIDIDILYYNSDIIDAENLIIPHPLLQQRRFALIPLCEVMPEYVHPIFMKTNQQLLSELTDNEIVTKI